MAGQNKNWREIRRQLPLNEGQVAMYRRLMDAEARLEKVRRRRGVSETALDASESEDYLTGLAHYVAELGGHLEVRAVFADETITLLREPDPE
ncbi:MAG TPA: hypothetical protein VMB27_06015 [Solirubrobacteraceae bacterium]|nr:hypothetical protein [Solirubrobacteraceae bacterium]